MISKILNLATLVFVFGLSSCNNIGAVKGKQASHSLVSKASETIVDENLELTGTAKSIFVELLGKKPENLEEANAIAQDEFLRPSGKERSESGESRFTEKFDSILPALTTLGFVNGKKCEIKRYILILGATAQTMLLRAKFLKQELEAQNVENPKIFFLVSSRELKLQGDKINFLDEKDKTEADAGRKIGQMLFPGINVEYIESPNRPDGSRANTEDTYQAFLLRLLKDFPTPQKGMLAGCNLELTAISNAHNIPYQQSVADNFFSKPDVRRRLSEHGILRLVVNTIGGTEKFEDPGITTTLMLDSFARAIHNILSQKRNMEAVLAY